MITTHELIQYLDQLLNPQLFKDYCPNGWQVAGRAEIKKLVTGVSANQALIEQAAENKADALLVHHGFFWNGENPCVVGLKYSRLSKLIEHRINLIAYHLPLDAHAELGNNIQLAKLLNIIPNTEIVNPLNLVREGKLQNPMSGEQFAKHIEMQLARVPFYIPGRSEKIHSIAWCTGGAQDFIQQAIDLKVDAYLTGEVSERTVSIARESGIHFYAAGHHATERYGVKALGIHLAQRFGLEHQFIDINNPV